jgi:hypothetical protein
MTGDGPLERRSLPARRERDHFRAAMTHPDPLAERTAVRGMARVCAFWVSGEATWPATCVAEDTRRRLPGLEGMRAVALSVYRTCCG